MRACPRLVPVAEMTDRLNRRIRYGHRPAPTSGSSARKYPGQVGVLVLVHGVFPVLSFGQ
jgi:hypothetical protein